MLYKDLIAYLETLIVPQGRLVGEPLTVFGWERKFLKGAFSQLDDAGLSLARGGGKTTLIAGLAAAALDGPLVVEAAETLVVASSFEQGLIGFRHLLRFLAPAIERNPKRFRVQDSQSRAAVTDRDSGAMVRVVGSDPRRLHGAAPLLLIYDELSQWPPGSIDAMLSALETSRGKIPGSKALWIGTRPAAPDHPFERALNGGLGYAQVHAARDSDNPFHRRTWKRANPGLDHLPDLEDVIRREAAKAKLDPSALATFQALRLNMGVSDVIESVLLEPETWNRIEAADCPAEGGYILGVDLGTSAAMSACAAYWPDSGRLECFAVFPELPTLEERGLSDGVGPLYQTMERRGELVIAGQRVSDVGGMLGIAAERWGYPSLITADRWREAELREKLESARFPVTTLESRGMGYRDGGEDVRLFRAACLAEDVRPVPSLLLRSAMAEARVTTDPAGNSKLAKGAEGGRRRHARDDAAAAAVLAVAAGQRRRNRPAETDLVYAVV